MNKVLEILTKNNLFVIITLIIILIILIIVYILRKRSKLKDLDMILSEEVSPGQYSVESIEREKGTIIE